MDTLTFPFYEVKTSHLKNSSFGYIIYGKFDEVCQKMKEKSYGTLID